MAYISFQPSDYFNTKLYTGNSTDNHAITGVGFTPDFTWIKARANTYDHMLFDALRGTGSLRENLRSNSSNASSNDSSNVKTLDSDGFTLGTGGYVNNSVTFASWNWKANGAGSANTDGSISSTVSANTTAGFSIVKYTGNFIAATVGHGLGEAPKAIFFKNASSAANWNVYHHNIGAGKRLYLNSDAKEVTASNYMNDTAPTSTVFSLEIASDTNGDGDTQIAYCFAEKQGFSKFGSYVGNGSTTDGPFTYTGFLPAFVMIKCTSALSDWWIWDSKREPNNLKDLDLYPNQVHAEDTALGSNGPDFLSNGFKFQSSGVTAYEPNVDGASYIYMAFAEFPLISSNDVPGTAR